MFICRLFVYDDTSTSDFSEHFLIADEKTDRKLQNLSACFAIDGVRQLNNDEMKTGARCLVPYSNTESVNTEELTPMKSRKLTRKRKRNPQTWKKNIRKSKRQRGEAYINTSGKLVAEKELEHVDCECTWKCFGKISKDDRESLKKSFYSLDENGKKKFIIQNTNCNLCKTGDVNVSRKKTLLHILSKSTMNL